jgi:thioredoxin reductase (NADPH)
MSTKPSSEETPDLQGAFPRLSDAQIAALDAQRRPTQPGDVLFAEGDRDWDFFVVLAGKAASVEGHGTPEAIVGGGNSAGQAAVFLSAHAAQVTLIVREHDLGDHMSRYLVDEIARIGNVHVMTGTEVRELHGEAALEAVTVTDNRTGTRRTIDARALFVFIGMAPCTGWLGGLVDLDDRGFVRTGPGSDGAERSLLETSQPGIFAVGDVRAGSAKRVATAVGEGAMAIRLAFERTRPT